MDQKNLPIILSAVVLVLATIYFLIQKNNEFILYAVTLAILIGVLYKTDQHFNFMPVAKWGFFIWMVLHMAGGLIIAGTRTYDIILFNWIGSPYDILKYDQVVHAAMYFVMTLLMYSVLMKIVKTKPNKIIFGVILVLAATSIGAVNEMIEFAAVILFQSSGVGGYYNTAIDLVMNFIGSLLAIVFLKYKKIF